MDKVDKFQNESVSKGNSEDSLLVIYILQILKKYSSRDHQLSSQDVMHHLKEDYSIGIEGKTEALRKKVRRHLDTLCEFYWDPCIKKSEGKTRSGHKWFYDISRDKSAKNNAVSHETLSKEEIDFLIDMVASSKIINSAGTIGIVEKLLKKTDISHDERKRRLKALDRENFTKSINEEIILVKEEIDSCINDVRKIEFDYEDKKVLVTPYGWNSDESGKYILIAKAFGTGKGEFEYFSLEKIDNVKKMEFDYCEEDDTYYDIPRSFPDRMSMERLFPNIRVINDAIKNNNSVEFKYLTYVIKDKKVVIDGKDKRIVPHGLVFTDGKYYLIGYDESAKIDYYRVDLISKLRLADKKIKLSYRDVQKLSDFQRAREIEKHPLMLAGTEISVTFKVVESALDRVINAFAVSPDNFKVTEQTRAVNDSSEESIVEVKVTTTHEEAYRFALANADAVEICTQDIRDRIARISEPVYQLYTQTLSDKVRENLDYVLKNKTFKISCMVDKDTAYETYKVLSERGQLGVVDNMGIASEDLRDGVDYFGEFINTDRLIINNAPQLKNMNWASKLINVKELKLRNSQIEDISWMKEMKKLKWVDLSNSSFTDLSVLSEHKNIDILDINGTDVRDISFIENFPKLEQLLIATCPIEDYSPLFTTKSNLKYLEIDKMALEKIGEENIRKRHIGIQIKETNSIFHWL